MILYRYKLDYLHYPHFTEAEWKM